MVDNHSQHLLSSAAPGLEILYETCRQVYPQQQNPLQVTAFIKYWLGGPDPLDYISMYDHPGIPELHIPPHWHYISFGLTDLHGDGRVHEASGPEFPSGFGFELTFRLMKSSSSSATGERSVKFLQVVAVTEEELQMAQHWNGAAILELLRRVPSAGGPWLVADMKRQLSLFELQPSFRHEVEHGIDRDGCSLSGVSARCFWEERRVTSSAGKLGSAWRSPEAAEEEEEDQGASSQDDEEEEPEEQVVSATRHRQPDDADEFWPIRRLYKGVHLTLNLEAASLLPVVLRYP
nr:EOG090X09WX [Eurycercus lamellatus]